jgi:shikimate kinase
LEGRFVLLSLTRQKRQRTVDNKADKDALIEALLQERDELYQELSKLRHSSGGDLEHLRQL